MQVQVNRVSEALIEASTSEAETTIEVAGIPINHYEENCLVYQNNREFSRNRLKCGDLFFLHRMLVEKSWVDILDGEFDIEYAVKLCKFVENEEPYAVKSRAMELTYSVPKGRKLPSELENILIELSNDIGCPFPSHGNLKKWALQGILLLNFALTVRKKRPNSHANKGWEHFTDAVIKTISDQKSNVVFLLWGKMAQEKILLIDESKHYVLQAASPGKNGFFDCK
ncbi:uracil-DNA glycosylase, mitochondrial [Lathyrus oleraceus]|uniref:Uracil-DNA glycosylase n=1 Tax=Pisum sativum TaxID=3888 RepID=A0A9D5BLJ6_PEA|nr:uracil-DNA glycosylase, mitochondrial-like [Pisum sativum]KAI5445976.1 hypothetical protein KIW84_013992 [Pisum sativum]KAI5445978.1 hypothetical protein KIW84_013993 [Pisum sativum]